MEEKKKKNVSNIRSHLQVAQWEAEMAWGEALDLDRKWAWVQGVRLHVMLTSPQPFTQSWAAPLEQCHSQIRVRICTLYLGGDPGSLLRPGEVSPGKEGSLHQVHVRAGLCVGS